MSQKQTLVPKLRFPEFRKEPGWEEKTIGDVCKFKAGDFVQAAQITDYPKEGLFPCYGGNGLRGYVKSYTHEGRYVLVGRQGALCGNVNLFEDKFHATEHALVATPELGIDTGWLYYSLTDLKLNQFSIGQAQPGLSVSVLNGIAMMVPAHEKEQQRIADCLSSLDELIAAEGRKWEHLRTYKKGLMQQLFPRVGERVPRLRFPEFRNAGEWEEKPLGEVVDFQTGGTPSKANPAFWKGSIPWVSAKDMKQLCLDDAEDHITAAAVDDGAKLVPGGTVLMLTRGMTLLKDVPICILSREMSFNQDVKALRAKEDLDGRFLAYMLTASKQRLLSMVDVAGHGTGRLDTEELKALNMALPPPTEQRHIAECLSALNAQITAQSEKLAALRTHKKGLMQQLFPSAAEEGAG